MILEKITLVNFRQFYGSQSIDFATDPMRNVTLIHAENGFGKTTILNAFRWALHGNSSLSSDFEKPDALVNEHATREKGDDAEAKVELVFKRDEQKVIVIRSITRGREKSGSDQGQLQVYIKTEQGVTRSPENPQNEIRSIIPPGITEFLFFNGESIDNFAREESSADVAGAIRLMMGLELLQRAIDDLQNQSVLGKFRKELRDKASDEKAELISRQEKLEDDSKSKDEERRTVLAEIEALDLEITSIDNKLASNKDARDLQNKRTQLESDIITMQGTIQQLDKELLAKVQDDAYVLLLEKVIPKANELIDKWRADGQIPAQVLDTFLKDLLKAGKCICQRDLAEGSAYTQAVKKLLNIAGDQNFNTAAGELDRTIGNITGSAGKIKESIEDLNRQRLGKTAALRRLREEREQVSRQLGNKEDNSVAELEERRRKASRDRDDFMIKKGAIDVTLQGLAADIKKLKEDISALADDEREAILAQRRVTAIDETISTLRSILDHETRELIPELEKEINIHFPKAVNQSGYWAEIDADFSIKVRKSESGVAEPGNKHAHIVAKNQALRQALSLCFIGSLVHLAGKRSKLPTILQGLTESSYPIVMDSPFGSMDSGTQAAVATIIPQLAPQVVAMVSSSQYQGAVASTLESAKNVGKRYLLRYKGNQLPHEKAKRSMDINGAEVKLFETSEFEHTEIINLS
jgi:DNA sulfur modification protein DndD